MRVEAEIEIHRSKAAVWDVITDIERASTFISGIERVEIVERPDHGLVGLRWRETRVLFGKPATAEKWITEVAENDFYTTTAEDNGFVFLATLRMAEASGGTILTSVHVSEPRGIVAGLMSIPMGLFFKGVARKALLQDLHDIKAAVERG